MPATDFFEGMLYEQMEPFADRRLDLLAGQIQATMANIHRSEKTKAYSAQDFMPSWDRQQSTEFSPEQQRKVMRIFEVVHNAKIKQQMGRQPS